MTDTPAQPIDITGLFDVRMIRKRVLQALKIVALSIVAFYIVSELVMKLGGWNAGTLALWLGIVAALAVAMPCAYYKGREHERELKK